MMRNELGFKYRYLCRCEELEDKNEETRRKKIEEELTQALIRCVVDPHCKTALSEIETWDVSSMLNVPN
jgi:hypothetical protein